MSDRDTFEPVGSVAMRIVAGIKRRIDATDVATRALEAEADEMKQSTVKTEEVIHRLSGVKLRAAE